MVRVPILRAAAAIVGGLAAAAGLFGLLAVADAGRGPLQQVIAGPGWLIPIVAGGIVGTLAWVLLSGNDHVEPDPTTTPTATCPSCDSQVLSDWRLCPYCGRFVDESQEGDASFTGDVLETDAQSSRC